MFSVEEYIDGLQIIRKRMNPKHYEMLQAQYCAPNRTVTAPQLTKSVGYPNFNSANPHYGKLGRMIYEAIQTFSRKHKHLEYNWFLVLSSGAHGTRGYLWTMRPELATALEELGLVKNVEAKLPEEVNSSEVLLEGAIRRVIVNAYERSAEARSLCIARYGTRCVICDFDFGLSYGELLEGYIHVHHLRPLPEIREEYDVDPINDLRPVCPNCHAVIHSRSLPFTIDEVKEMLACASAN